MSTKANILAKLTLVIPTYNRQSFALRNMRFWNKREASVHILDGSQKPIPTEELQEFNPNIHYHHLPVTMVERLAMATELVSNEYTILLADDEFHMPKAIESSIEELQCDKNLQACIGRSLGFEWSAGQMVSWPFYPEQRDYAILQDSAIERMIHHMTHYTPSIIYSVVRTEIWKKALNTFLQRDFPIFGIGEIQFELSVCYLGKSKVIPALMWLRGRENPSMHGSEPHMDPNNSFSDWWTDDSKSQEREEMLQLMASNLSQSDDRGYLEVKEEINQSLEAYNKFLFRYQKGKDWFCSQPLVKKPLWETANLMRSSGISVDFECLREIESLVSAFHQKN